MPANRNTIPLKHTIVVVILILAAFFLLLPLPYYQSWEIVCKPGQTDCPKPGFHMREPLIFTLFRLFLYSGLSNTTNVVRPTPTPTPLPTNSPSPSVKPTGKKPSEWTCPENGYIDCMPIIEPGRRWQCEKSYIDWARSTCPGFQGIAY